MMFITDNLTMRDQIFLAKINNNNYLSKITLMMINLAIKFRVENRDLY